MGCCEPFVDRLIAQAATPVGGGIRRDVIANQGNATDYGHTNYVEPFIEDRSASNKGDVFWIPMFNGASWKWVNIFTADTSAGSSPW